MMRRIGQAESARPWPGRTWVLGLGALVCAGLMGGLVTPVQAAPHEERGSDEVQLGSFALGDGLEGTIGELDGAFGFALAAGGMQLAWSSRAAGADPVGLGPGWSFGLAGVRVTGGIWVFPASGGAFEMDAASPTGLAGYPRSNVRFAAAEPGALVPARPDGSQGDVPYAYVLHELGGVSSYFDEDGHPIARLVLGGDRLDWRWEDGTGHLLAVMTADGSVTALDWTDPARVTIEPGSNVTGAAEGSGVGGRWVVELDGGRVSAVVDPVGATTQVSYTDDGLVERVSTPSGASTLAQWAASTDGVARVRRVQLLDERSGAELSVREWAIQGEVAPTGWPLDAGSRLAAASSGYETAVSDGKTTVTSAVDPLGRLTERAVVVTSRSGERRVQGQTFGYPEGEAPPGSLLGRSQPVEATTTYFDDRGGSRSVSESYTFDELDRMRSRTTTDGSKIERRYDEAVPAGHPLPVGLVLEELTTAPDGLVTAIRSELSEDRASAVATERWSGDERGELARVERLETDVEAGFVTEERAFPGGDGAAVPVVTKWSKHVDLVTGTKTIEQTVAAGAEIAATTRSTESIVHGGVLSETDEVGNVTSARYDRSGRRTSIHDAAGRSTGFAHRTRQADGVNAATTTAATGVAVTETQDALGRVIQRSDNIDPSGRAAEGFERVFETFDRTTPGVERMTDAWGAVTTTEQDVFGRTTRVTHPNGVVQLAVHDDVAGTATAGISATDDLADAESTVTSTLDTAGRITRTVGTRSDGVAVPESSTVYDGSGREIRSTDGFRETITEYDARGDAVATRVSPAGDVPGGHLTATRTYDGFGVSVEKTLRSEAEARPGPRRELDELGRVASQTDQRDVAERTTFTPDGLPATIVSETGRVVTNEYDQVTRELVSTRVSSPGGVTVATAFRYDDAGRLTSVFDPADEAGTTIAYESDDFGNVTSTRYPDGAEIRHEFDPHGRKTATVDAAGNRTALEYGPDGALLAASQTDPDGAPLSGVRYGYDEYGRVNLLERGNGVRTAYTFTSAAEVRSEVTTAPDGVRSEREYTYTPAGTLSTRIDRVRGEAGELTATRTDYEYDGHDRLIRSELRAGDTPTGQVRARTSYEPTIGGDLASETTTVDPDTAEAETTTREFEYSALGELVAISTNGDRAAQDFDTEGNLVAAATGARYAYDAAGRVVAQTTAEGVVIDTTYWADGSRRAQSTTTGSTRLYWDGTTLLNEVHDSGSDEQGIASYLIGTSRQARSVRRDGDAPSTSYYGTDRHGNVTDLTDRSGAETTQYSYTDYGIVTVAGAAAERMPAGIGEVGYNPFQYAGEYTFRDGTQALGRRLYDVEQARFTSKDDAPLANLYAFADLNPISNVDPSGRESEADRWHIGLLFVGFFAAALGAVLLLTTPGAVFSAFGVVSALVMVGDAVLAAVQLAEAAVAPDHFDDHALAIASWAFFAGSMLTALGGVFAKAATAGGKRSATTCMELFDCAGGSAVKRGRSSGSSSSSSSGEELLKPAKNHGYLSAHLKLERFNEWLSAARPEQLANVVAGVGSKRARRNLDVASSALATAKKRSAAEVISAGPFLREAREKARDAIVVAEVEVRQSLKLAKRYLEKAEIRLGDLVDGGNEVARRALSEVRATRREVGALLSHNAAPSRSPSPASAPGRNLQHHTGTLQDQY